ncbi:hypothetical protein [Microvirga sp. P5_D2]
MNTKNPYAAIKAAFDADVDRLGGVVVAAGKTRVGQALISRYSSISDQNITTHVPADVLHDITMEIIRRGGEPETLRLLADLAGFKLVPRAQAEEATAAPIARQLSDITRAMGALMTETAEAVADGVVDDAEKLSIDVAASVVETEVAELRQATGLAKVVPISTNGKGAA